MGSPVAAGAAPGAGGLFAAPELVHERLPDGAVVMRSTRPPGAVPRSLGAVLQRWAAAEPSRTFLAERDATGRWRSVTYAETARAVKAIAQALIERRLGPRRPLAILAENGIDHALMALGAMHIGVPVVPISTAYARLSQDFGKLRYILGLVEPGLIYVDEADRYAKALEAIGALRTEVVASRGSLAAKRATLFAALTEVKLAPDGDKLEIRVKGPNVTPGYFKAPDLTRQLFDADGWLKTGDAARLAEPGNPAAGLMFDGRVAE